jgi:hypothetical protein
MTLEIPSSLPFVPDVPAASYMQRLFPHIEHSRPPQYPIFLESARRL